LGCLARFRDVFQLVVEKTKWKWQEKKIGKDKNIIMRVYGINLTALENNTN
jgi:hypothetical protein